MPRIDFAPDGIHYRTLKKGTIGKMWDYFTQDPWIRRFLVLNPLARFKLIGEKKLIGILSYDKETGEFNHSI